HHDRAQREHRRRVVVGGIAVCEVSADGRAVADEGIGDDARGVEQDGEARPHDLRPLQRGLAGAPTDAQVAAFLAHVLQTGNPSDVDEVLRRPQPQLEQREQALPSGAGAVVAAGCAPVGCGAASNSARTRCVNTWKIWSPTSCTIPRPICARIPVMFTREVVVTSVSEGPFVARMLVNFRSAPPRPRTSWPLARISAVRAAASSFSNATFPL